jgi:hypothetical protein
MAESLIFFITSNTAALSIDFVRLSFADWNYFIFFKLLARLSSEVAFVKQVLKVFDPSVFSPGIASVMFDSG